MAREIVRRKGFNPFADSIGLEVGETGDGFARFVMPVAAHIMNPHRVVHGAAIYAMADNGMGAALYTTLADDETCSTIEIKINYMRPVTAGTLICDTTVVHRGRSTAVLESAITNDGQLVARAQGTFSIGARRETP